jgi:hypothetical protein
VSDAGPRLHTTANGQIAELIELFSTREEAVLSLPCPGRAKLGEGTVAACASHAADNYLRIAAFLDSVEKTPPAHGHGGGPHRTPSSLTARDHASGPGHGGHGVAHTAEQVDRQSLLQRLSAAGGALSALAALTDEQLDAVPPAGNMKFCDGQRTLEQIITNLLNHQSHQLDAIRAALT